MKVKRLKYIDKLSNMEIPKEDFVIYGSSPLVLRGLKEKNNDLDVLVKENLWDKLSVKYPQNIKGRCIDIDGLSFAKCDEEFFGDMENILNKSDVIDGYHIMNLEQTIKWKEKTGDSRHIKDAEKIKGYLKGFNF